MSGANANISIIVGFDDKALAGIPGARKSIDSLGSGARRAGKGLRNLNEGGRAEKLEKGLRGVARESHAAFDNIGRIVGPLGIITSAASIAGLGALSREWASFGNQLNNSAQRAGVGAATLSTFQVAATLTGASAQAATAGMTALNDTIFNVATGHGQDAIAAFGQLHVALR
ncbi:MAG TPA: hypothetical protein VHX12_12850, partial [Acidisoma sp.]|nr:hypothetical protein [Acidisoma sp.]